MRSLLTKAFDALWAIPGTDRQIVRKASEPVIPWVRSSPGWPIRYHRSYPKTQDGAAPKREKRIPEYLEADEVNAIIRAAPSPKAKLLMLQQWRAGLRVSEALDLEVRDLSLDTATPTLRVRSGKGGKTRLVPVHPELHSALSSALAYGDISQGKIIEAHTTTAWRWVKTAVKRAEELGAIAPGKRIGTHTLRHSYARHLLMNGIPINYLSRWLGHSSIQTTLIYLELVPDPTGSLAMVPCGQRQLFWPLCANYFGRSGSGVIVVCNCRSCACRPCASLVR